MRKVLIVLVLGAALGLPLLDAPVAASAPASPAVSSTDGMDVPQFLALLNGQEPLPAAACSVSVRCYSNGQLLACSGNTCFKFNGCYVTCDHVTYECPPGGTPVCP